MLVVSWLRLVDPVCVHHVPAHVWVAGITIGLSKTLLTDEV